MNKRRLKVTRADNRIARCRAPTRTQGRCKHARCKHTWVKIYDFFQNISKLKWNMFSRFANVFFNPPSSNTYFLDCIVVSPSHSVVALNRSFKFNFCSATLFSLFFWNGNFIFALFPIFAFFCHLCATDMRCWNIPDVCIFICIYILLRKNH